MADQVAAAPIHITDESFENEVLKSDIPVLVDFWAEWCAPCKMIAPVLEQVAREQAGKLKVAKLDVDAYGMKAMEYGVSGIPTLILFKNGQPQERIVGYVSKDRLMSRLKPHLS